MRYGHPHFQAEGFVSIWIGTFPSEEIREEQLHERYGEEYEDEPLALWMGEFGFGYFDHDFMDTSSHGMEVRPLRELIEQCSYATSFVEEALQMAEQHGVSKTQFVMLLYDFRYDSSITGVIQGKYLRFLGAFPYTNTTREGS
jgi:hypothetical protein